MGLSFGWRANEVRESIWSGDSALGEVPEAAMAKWREDGDAGHLAPYATNGAPSKITFRNLTPDEAQVVRAYYDAPSTLEAALRATLMCFRIAVDFPEAPNETRDQRGVRLQRIVKERGLRLLSNEWVAHIEQAYPGIVRFYGDLVFAASFPTNDEKKASSPPSTPPLSSPPGDGQAPAAGA